MWKDIRYSVEDNDYFGEFTEANLNKIWEKAASTENWVNQRAAAGSSLNGLKKEMDDYGKSGKKFITEDAQNYYLNCLKGFYGIPTSGPCPAGRRRRSDSSCVVVPDIVEPTPGSSRQNHAMKNQVYSVLLLLLYFLF